MARQIVSGKRYVIDGGVPLRGTVQISGAKNAAIKEIAASLLTDQPLVLRNVPGIADVAVDLEIVGSLGVAVSRLGANSLRLQSPSALKVRIPRTLAARSRAAVIAMGPLLAREGKVVLPTPGGCPIGKRPLDRHLSALESLGAQFAVDAHRIEGKVKKLRGGRIIFRKNTVMGTENALLAAVLAEGETEIAGAAVEPEVDDLILLLRKMGARIQRDPHDPRTVMVQGVSSLTGACHEVLPDRNEAVTFAVAAAATCGDVTLSGVESAHLEAFLYKLEEVGVPFEASPGGLRVWSDSKAALRPVEVETAPHPGFMTDWQQPMTLLLAQAEGESWVHETVYEDRWKYLGELKKFGIHTTLCTPNEAGRKFDPSRYNFDWSRSSGPPKAFARVEGPTELQGAKVRISDLRAGATLVLAALAAEGRSEVYGVEHIERGYERFEEKLSLLGARIKKG
ncbi:MAG: UDP-N-acetylglucosamine 1-carboxyvinyltransferase [Patescibacteria group bacterium]|nr:MAG: UDP-N-acetylglucosamine 1-carboxyvinyltransferase [Patescibacteria group bacterium]